MDPMTRRLAQRLGIVLAAALVVTAVGAFATTRQAGDGPGLGLDAGEGITVALPTEVGAGGSAGGPGPSADGATDGAPTLDGDPNSTATPGDRGVFQVPDIRLTFRTMLSLAGRTDATFAYRSAVEARDAAEYAIAAELFYLVSARGGPLAPFAQFRAAQMVALAEAPAAAADRYATLLVEGGPADDLPVSVRAIALTEGARSLEEADRIGEALAALERIDRLGVGSFARATALAERARITQAAGGVIGGEGWQDLAIRAMTTEPGSTAARSALDLLDEAGEPYPRLVAAYVAYRAFRNDDAVARYEALLDEDVLTVEEDGQAWFYLGALRERAFDREGAIAAYERSLTVDPDGAFADDSRYWRGRVLEELGRPVDAAAEYDLLVADAPTSTFAEDARLRAAVALGLAGSGADATTRLAEITRTASPSAAAEAAHWHDVLVALFDAPAAELAPAADYDPTSYAAAFEAAGAAVVGPLPDSARAEKPTPVAANRVPIDVWIASATSATREVESPILAEDDVELAWILADAGEPAVARGLLNAELFSRRDQPYELVGLALEAQARGLHDVALNAASVILGQVSPAQELTAPRELLALAYPVPFLAEATAAAEEFEIPVLLLYALMRQESAFDPSAGSSAGAFGLTQVIYPTGEAIASDLGVEGWTFADLATPALSTRFGAYYLAVQLDQFDGHMLAALAAYNGGPGNAARWLEAQSFAGPDGYLYAVDFTETRLYLELVSANYAMYRYIYAGAAAPSLPHGD